MDNEIHQSQTPTPNEIDSKITRFWKGFKDAFAVITGIISIAGFVVLAIYTYGSNQTAQAAEIQTIKDKIVQTDSKIESRGTARDKQLESIEEKMATKDDINNLANQIQLQRQEDKETRDLIYKFIMKQ